MPFSFHPPTGRPCEVCDELLTHVSSSPIIDTHNGKASSANNFPFHNWYNFVLGYSPEFPEYMIRREALQKNDLVLDPFMGTGTTLVTCKQHQIPSEGIDANDFIVDAARAKLNWNLDLAAVSYYRDELSRQVEATYHGYTWGPEEQPLQLSLFAPQGSNGLQDYQAYVTSRRPEMLLQKYISDKPLARALMIDDAIKTIIPNGPIQE